MKGVAAALFALVWVFLGPAYGQGWALQGTVVIPDSVVEDGVVVVADDRITVVGKDAKPPMGVVVQKIPGIIVPGFIDLHNHLTWNVFPRWHPAQKFSNRYEWQTTAEYDRVLRIPQGRLIANGLGCKANLFAEVKALVGGATSIAGSFIGRTDAERACVAGLVRNLDHSAGFAKPPSSPPCGGEAPPIPALVANEVFPIEASFERLNWLRCELQQGTVKGLLIHLAEGKPNDAAARREFRMLKGQGLVRAGVGIIHGTALALEDFQAMRDNGAGLVWSPRSNDELYGGTTNILAAQAEGVMIAIGPDWSPTGSGGVLQELNYAAARYAGITAKQYLAMATSTAAKIVRLDDRIGSLAPGKMADLVVIRSRGGAAYETVVTATPADVLLVAVGGVPLYGDPALMTALVPGKKLEDLTVCGEPKKLFLATATSESWDTVRGALEAELQRYGSNLSSFECS
jgi:hypothetical protein